MTKFQNQKLHGDSIFKQAYVVIGKKQYESLEYVGDSKWSTLKEAEVARANEVLSEKKWVVSEIPSLIKER